MQTSRRPWGAEVIGPEGGGGQRSLEQLDAAPGYGERCLGSERAAAAIATPSHVSTAARLEAQREPRWTAQEPAELDKRARGEVLPEPGSARRRTARPSRRECWSLPVGQHLLHLAPALDRDDNRADPIALGEHQLLELALLKLGDQKAEVAHRLANSAELVGADPDRGWVAVHDTTQNRRGRDKEDATTELAVDYSVPAIEDVALRVDRRERDRTVDVVSDRERGGLK